MSTSVISKQPKQVVSKKEIDASSIERAIQESWDKIAPFWPLKTLNAVNPLRGFESLSFEEALVTGSAYFQAADLPEEMVAVNRETIKWLQAFFDEGQATLPLPHREKGLYSCWRQLAQHDGRLHKNRREKKDWLAALPDSPQEAIAECLKLLGVAPTEQAQFLTLLLTTLPGWAAHIKYRTDWRSAPTAHPHPVSGADYLAVRIATISLLWTGGAKLLDWHKQVLEAKRALSYPVEPIEQNERNYRPGLIERLGGQSKQAAAPRHTPAAQLVFCIDVRSEPFRRALEQAGDYETFGYAGFFGVPIQINDEVSGDTHPACPVLLKPGHEVRELPAGARSATERDRTGYSAIAAFKRGFQTVKYTFSTPFALVEMLGLGSAAWIGLKSLSPRLAAAMQRRARTTLRPDVPLTADISGIPEADQFKYAEGGLRLMGLTSNFAPLVVLCGHGSSTENNAYSSGLDCGACGGRHGSTNAHVLAQILNRAEVRAHLAGQGIEIPAETLFVAGQHDTTTDEMAIFAPHKEIKNLAELEQALQVARKQNTQRRIKEMGCAEGTNGVAQTKLRSIDWSQVRPEWGLAGNASFIVGPRTWTKNLDLGGRSFLHSYDYTGDPEGALLTTILTAPMVVAQWINSQYLFSSFDNVAYGAGSKVTKNITGKIGVMQGNASDLMHGLPLQSVYSSDTTPYHLPARLMTTIYAPRALISGVIDKQSILQQLFGNGWVTLVCLDPEDSYMYELQRNFEWKPLS